MEIAVNNFIGGLNLDSHPSAVSQNNLTDALNATVRTYNGNELMLQNDMGNTMIQDARTGTTVGLSEGFIPLGMKEHGGVLYIASYNPKTKEGELGSIPSPLITYTLANTEISKEVKQPLTYAEGTNNIIESFVNNNLTTISENIYSPGDCFLIVLDLELPEEYNTWNYTAENTIWDFNTKGWAVFPVITKNTDKQHKGLFRIELYAKTQTDTYLIGSTKSKYCSYYIKKDIDLKHSNYWFILKSDLCGYSIDARRTLASNNFVSYPNVPEGSLSIKAAVEKPEITGFTENNGGLKEPFVIASNIVTNKGSDQEETGQQYYMIVTALEGKISGWPISKINIKLKETATNLQIFEEKGITLTNYKIETLENWDSITLDVQKENYNHNGPIYGFYVPNSLQNYYEYGNRIYYRKYFQEYKQQEKLYIAGTYSDESTLLEGSKTNGTNKYDPLFVYALADNDNYKNFTFEISYYYTDKDGDYLIDTKVFSYTTIFIEKKPYVTVQRDDVQIGGRLQIFQEDAPPINLFTPLGDDNAKKQYQLMACEDGEYFIPEGDKWTGAINSIPKMHLSFQAVAAVDTDALDGNNFWSKAKSINAVFLPNIALTTRQDWDVTGNLNWEWSEYYSNLSTNTMGWTWFGSINTRLEEAEKGNTKLYLFSPRGWVSDNDYGALLHKYTGNNEQKIGKNIVDKEGYFIWSECAKRGIYDYDKLDDFKDGLFFQIDGGITAGESYTVYSSPQDDDGHRVKRIVKNGQKNTLKTFTDFNQITSDTQAIPGMAAYTSAANLKTEQIRDCNLLTSEQLDWGYGNVKTAVYENVNLGSEYKIPDELNTSGGELSIYKCFELFLASYFHTYGLQESEVYFKSGYHVNSKNPTVGGATDATVSFNRKYNICKKEPTEFTKFLTNVDLAQYYLTIHYPALKSIRYRYGSKVKVDTLLSAGSAKYDINGKFDPTSDVGNDGVTCDKDGVLTLNAHITQSVIMAQKKWKNLPTIDKGGTSDFLAIAPEGCLYIDLSESNYQINQNFIQQNLLTSKSCIYYKTIGGDVINSDYYNTNDETCKEVVGEPRPLDELAYNDIPRIPINKKSSFNDKWEDYRFTTTPTPITIPEGDDGYTYAKILGAVKKDGAWDVIPLDYRIQKITEDNTITIPANCVFSSIHLFNMEDEMDETDFAAVKEQLFGDCGVICEYDISVDGVTYDSVYLPYEDSAYLQITNLIPVVEGGKVKTSKPELKTKSEQ